MVVSRSLLGWRPVAFSLGVAILLVAILSPVDRLGREGLLTAHFAQHIALGDLAAPLILLGLPTRARHGLGNWLDRIASSRARPARLATALLSPVGALFLWVAVTYLWFVPAVHLAAVGAGLLHTLDHVSFLLLGFVIWLGAFDPRRTRSTQTALREGGLPWWARHIYAMVARFALFPPAFGVWLAATSDYYRGTEPLPFDVSRATDKVQAASLMIGFEMILFVVAVLLAFVFVSVSEGRHRARPAPR